MQRFQLVKAKPKSRTVIVRQMGNPQFDYHINVSDLSCRCTKSQSVCQHLLYYLTCGGFPEELIPFLRVPSIRSKIREGNLVTPDDIMNVCKEYLFDDSGGCCVCTSAFIPEGKSVPFRLEDSFYMCPSCSNILHIKCYRSWGKGCPSCRYGPS